MNTEKAPTCNLMPRDTEQLLHVLVRASPFFVHLPQKKVIHVVETTSREWIYRYIG